MASVSGLGTSALHSAQVAVRSNIASTAAKTRTPSKAINLGVGGAPSGFDNPDRGGFSWSSFVNGAVRAWGDDLVVGATGFKPKSREEAIGAAVGHIGAMATGLLEAGSSVGGAGACMVLSSGACLPLAEPLAVAGSVHGTAVAAKSAKDFIDSLRTINASSTSGSRSSGGGTSSSAWLTPDGKMVDVGGTFGHEKAAKKMGETVDSFLRKGAIRITDGGLQVHDFDKVNLDRMKEAVKFVTGRRPFVIMEDGAGRRATFLGDALQKNNYDVWSTEPMNGSIYEASRR
jgi:hypothetical protein